MLRLQVQGRVQLVRFPAFAVDRAVEEIAAVELDSQLIREDFHHAPASWIVEFDGLRQFAAVAIQHPFVVIAAALSGFNNVCRSGDAEVN